MAMFPCPKRDDQIGKIIWYILIALIIYGLISLVLDIRGVSAQEKKGYKQHYSELYTLKKDLLSDEFWQRVYDMQRSTWKVKEISKIRNGKLSEADSLWIARADSELTEIQKLFFQLKIEQEKRKVEEEFRKLRR